MPMDSAASQPIAISTRAGDEQRELVVQDRLHAVPEAPPAGTVRRAGVRRGPVIEAHQEEHLLPAPGGHCAREGDVGAGDAGVVASLPESVERQELQCRGAEQCPAERRARQAVEEHHDSVAEPPHGKREQQRQCEIRHACVYQAGAIRTCSGSSFCRTGRKYSRANVAAADAAPHARCRAPTMPPRSLAASIDSMQMRRRRSMPARNAGWSMSSVSGNTCLRDLRGDAEHLVVVLGRVDAQSPRACIGPRVVAHVHRREHGQQEEADPQPVARRAAGAGWRACSSANDSPWRNSSLHQLLEPPEDRVEALLGMALELAEDRDVARVADLLRQVGRVEDELRA